jgi:hypothetical protein
MYGWRLTVFVALSLWHCLCGTTFVALSLWQSLWHCLCGTVFVALSYSRGYAVSLLKGYHLNSACVLHCTRVNMMYDTRYNSIALVTLITLVHTSNTSNFSIAHKSIWLGLARTVYVHRIRPYTWWFPCQKCRIYTVYIWFWPILNMMYANSFCLTLAATFSH